MIILKDGKPFTGDTNLSADRVMDVVVAGLWDEKELTDRGLVLCQSFVPPEGKVVTGPPRYVDGKDGWVEEFDVVDAPPPRVPPSREEKFYLSTGFTIDELKALLGLI